MNKKFALAGVALFSAVVLAACGNGDSASNSSADTAVFNYVYSTDPETLDYVLANKSSTGDIVANLVDGLLENDQYGNLVPSLAEDWSVSEDGLTYTYTLREDAKWFTADGEEYATIVAEDFVTGLKHAADKKSEALYVIQESIVGLQEYLDGEETDFSKVGVKAVDERTVQYTLKNPEPYWNSKTTMGILFPVNADFLTSQGEDFGSPKPDSILYSGPFLLSGLTAKSAIEFEKNADYWDAENVHLDGIKWTYYDGSDPESLANNFLEGNYSVARVFPNTASYTKLKEEHGDIITYSAQDDVSYFLLPNLARTNYDNTAKTDDAQKEAAQKALLNKDFRQALQFAINSANYVAQSTGEDAAEKSVRNIQVPTEFVTLGEQDFAQLTAGYLTGEEWEGIDLTDAQEGLYSPEKAKAEFAKAKEALEAEGVSFPIHLDILTDQSAEIMGQQMGSLKESIESTLGSDNVVIDIHPVSADDYDNATYYATSVDQADFDISIGGWGPDYADPSTYLDIFKSVGSPYAVRFGVTDGESDELIKAVNWQEFDALVDAAAKETDLEVRYNKYAEAQAWLLDSGLARTMYSRGGAPRFTTVAPFTAPYGHLGIKGDVSFKYLQLQSEPVTEAEYEKAKAKWEEEKAHSNAEYQESLKNHIK